LKTSDFHYDLPPELIAQTPVEPRDSSRLLVLDRACGAMTGKQVSQITEYLRAGDVMVFNNSRVIPARLKGFKADTGSAVEILLLRRDADGTWEALVKPAKRLHPGSTITFSAPGAVLPGSSGVTARVLEDRDDGIRRVSFSDEAALRTLGAIPLPPYIHEPLARAERYQTVYAAPEGSVAAPTAGLHFTPELLRRLETSGVQCLFVTLHIGLDTFLPVREDDPSRHRIHLECGELSPETARAINQAKQEGRRVVCVGTTSVRLVEQAAQATGHAVPFQGWVNLFILPGYRFRITDALLTNFHLPQSTLLMLVSAFAGRELILRAYREAISQRYRFFSFGDAMLIL
jgi:S-adenosylmethionine:tRNA ribosyltransferase-isomerase